MKRAVSVYNELVDGFLYTANSWLHLDLAEATVNDGYVIAAASAFLFDNLFLKDGSGREITSAAAENLESEFNPEKLSKMATKMRLAMTGDDFSRGTSPLREYIRWIAKDEPTVNAAFLDDAGKLVLVTAEEIVNLLLAENAEQHAPLHVSEIVFLTVTDRYATFFLEYLGKEKFRAFKSFAYFEDVRQQMERIRAEIID